VGAKLTMTATVASFFASARLYSGGFLLSTKGARNIAMVAGLQPSDMSTPLMNRAIQVRRLSACERVEAIVSPP
jgi:hypothetical protein